MRNYVSDEPSLSLTPWPDRFPTPAMGLLGRNTLCCHMATNRVTLPKCLSLNHSRGPERLKRYGVLFWPDPATRRAGDSSRLRLFPTSAFGPLSAFGSGAPTLVAPGWPRGVFLAIAVILAKAL